MDFYLLLEIQVKSETVNTVTLNNNAKKSATDALETASKRSNQKTTEATGDLIEKKLLIKLQESQKLHQKLIQKQMRKKYLEKDIYLSKKDRKLVVI